MTTVTIKTVVDVSQESFLKALFDEVRKVTQYKLAISCIGLLNFIMSDRLHSCLRAGVLDGSYQLYCVHSLACFLSIMPNTVLGTVIVVTNKRDKDTDLLDLLA